MQNEIERKFYTVAIGCLALAAMVVFQSHFQPTYSSHTLHNLLRFFRKPFILINSETVGFEILAVLLCLPFLKATRIHLSIADSLIVSGPNIYLQSLTFCEGFDARFLAPIVAMPILFFGIFRLFSLRSIPSLVDDLPATQPNSIRILLAIALSFQFAVLFLLLSGASLPFRIKPSYAVFFLGTLAALAAILRPRVYLLLLAAAFTAINVYLFFWYLLPFIRANITYFSCP